MPGDVMHALIIIAVNREDHTGLRNLIISNDMYICLRYCMYEGVDFFPHP